MLLIVFEKTLNVKLILINNGTVICLILLHSFLHFKVFSSHLALYYVIIRTTEIFLKTDLSPNIISAR